jgi:hypothetical protein
MKALFRLALTLTVAVAACLSPAHADELAAGRAGAIQNLQFKGSPVLARMIAGECVGLIHIITEDRAADKLSWTVLTRDGTRTVVVVEAEVDESGAIVAQGEIAKGAFRGAKISARGYQQGDVYLIDVRMSLGDIEVAFTQALEPLEEAER